MLLVERAADDGGYVGRLHLRGGVGGTVDRFDADALCPNSVCNELRDLPSLTFGSTVNDKNRIHPLRSLVAWQ